MRVRLFSISSLLLAAALAAGHAGAREGVRQVPGTSYPPSSAGKSDPAAPARDAAPTSAATPVPTDAPSAGQVPAGSVAAGVDRGALVVTINRAKVIRLPERAQTVVVGNPAIADLSLQKNGIVVVTGKSYGATNLIALDGAGNMLAESQVNVVGQSDGLIVVQRAFDRYSYSCNPVCQPAVNLGDTAAYFNDARVQADAHNQFAVSR